MVQDKIDYEALAKSLTIGKGADWIGVFSKRIAPQWCEEYRRSTALSDILETTVDGFTYLFDVTQGRALGAYGISKGFHSGPRPAARMAGHPQSAGAKYHRGH